MHLKVRSQHGLIYQFVFYFPAAFVNRKEWRNLTGFWHLYTDPGRSWQGCDLHWSVGLKGKHLFKEMGDKKIKK